MKQYAVLGYNAAHIFDFPGPREARWAYWADGRQPSTNYSPSTFDGNCYLYYCDTETAANDLARFLATKWANIQWSVAKIAMVYQSTPGPVKVAALSDKGLLPV